MAERGAAKPGDAATRKADERALARLLRFVGNGVCAIDRQDGGSHLTRPDGAVHAITDAVLQVAARRGLLLLRAGRVLPTREARNWLRRHIAAREEAFLDQHRVIEIAEARIDGAALTVRVNAAESPLATLSRLRDRTGAPWFSADAIAAGERLARDFHFANLQPRVTQSYEPRLGERAGSGAAAELNDNVVAARLRVSAAVEAMGPDLSGVALDICCFEKGLELVERERQWPARSAKLMLRTALLQLDRHYNPPHSAPMRRSHVWHAGT